VLKNKKAFSLLEIVIVLSIMGAIIGIALPRLLDKKIDTRKVLREFMIAGKDLRSHAKLNGTTYRLAFQLDTAAQTWWVEKSNRGTLIDKQKLDAERENAKKTFLKEEDKKASDFSPDTSIFKKKQVLPKGYKFKQIESATQDTVVTEGPAYIHFFAQGLVESSAIQIEDPKKNIFTIIFNPITGQTDIIPEAKSLKDLAR
jgi:general secretion pathway protein H